MGLLDSILGSALGGSEGQGGARDPKVALLIGLVTMLMSRQGGAAQGGGDGGGRLGSLGSILGGAGAGGGAASGGLGGVLGDLLGGAAGSAGQAPGVEAGSLGGLGGLFQMLQNAGLGDALNSWIGGGPNQAVSAADISRAFGDGQLQQLADSAGVSQGEAAEHLSSLLPELVNKLTPDGQAPQGDLDIGSVLARFS
ncbi:YidB family protein [Pseudomonas aeruginosa]|nr:YidB family protein [Pseudomonas aeruginosa]